MKIDKDLAEKMARQFRAEMNKAARDGLIHESYFYTGKFKIHYAVEVRGEGGEYFDCHGDAQEESI